MKIFLPVLVLLFSSQSLAESAREKGTQIAQKVYKRKYAPTMSSFGELHLTPKKGTSRVRLLYSYRHRPKINQISDLIRFVEPKDIKDTGLLTLDGEGENVDQWIFLPALKKVRRIASGRKGGRFVTSEFFYEDLQDREVNQDKHVFIKDDMHEGAKTQLIESTPVDPKNSVYSKRLSWVHPTTLIPVRIDFFMGGGKEPVKRLLVKKIEKIDDIWTVLSSRMENLKNGDVSEITLKRIKHNTKLPESLFNRQTLEDPTREAKYREF